MSERDKTDSNAPDGDLLLKEKETIKRPDMYRVLPLNDDYTPMEFVVWVLQGVFYMQKEESVKVMLQVHKNGMGICGSYPYDVARTKVAQVDQASEKEGHPLQCKIEADAGAR
ncbi:MAG: ATP-dependent Clp protease adapter ClpS [Candidatus Lindowbacteria bacterium]|nr:ATP-dependent Clp protease adapter ClpS [Candidatus Lindowbacteria bacterium]